MIALTIVSQWRMLQSPGHCIESLITLSIGCQDSSSTQPQFSSLLKYSMLLLDTDLARIDVSHLQDKRRFSNAWLETLISIIRIERKLESWLFLLERYETFIFPAPSTLIVRNWIWMKRKSLIWEGKLAEIGDWISNCIFWAGKMVAIADWWDDSSTCEGWFAEMPYTWGKRVSVVATTYCNSVYTGFGLSSFKLQALWHSTFAEHAP